MMERQREKGLGQWVTFGVPWGRQNAQKSGAQKTSCNLKLVNSTTWFGNDSVFSKKISQTPQYFAQKSQTNKKPAPSLAFCVFKKISVFIHSDFLNQKNKLPVLVKWHVSFLQSKTSNHSLGELVPELGSTTRWLAHGPNTQKKSQLREEMAQLQNSPFSFSYFGWCIKSQETERPQNIGQEPKIQFRSLSSVRINGKKNTNLSRSWQERSPLAACRPLRSATQRAGPVFRGKKSSPWMFPFDF